MKSDKPKISVSPAVYDAAELAVDVGTNIFAARTKKGWTQKKLAELLGTLQPSVARVENGNALPSLDFLLRIAKALGTGLVAPTFESLLPMPQLLLPTPKIEEANIAHTTRYQTANTFGFNIYIGHGYSRPTHA